MSRGRTIIFEEEQTEFAGVSKRLIMETYAKAVFVVDVDGQLISEVGETAGIDTTGLASLVAGSTAATGGLAKMLGEEEFPVHFHEGRSNHLHVSLIQESIILVVVFDERSSLGLVRLRVKRAYGDMERILAQVEERSRQASRETMDLFGDITDDEIDSLFGDAF